MIVPSKLLAGGRGYPGGSNTHIQFNNSGAFSGSANFTWTEADTKLYVNGVVGIGITNPSYSLDIYGVFRTYDSNAASYTTLMQQAGSSLGYIYQFGGTYTSSGRNIAGSTLIDAASDGGLSLAAYHSTGVIRFFTNTNTTPRMQIDKDGNVGIGTIAPDPHAVLTANGGVFVSAAVVDVPHSAGIVVDYHAASSAARVMVTNGTAWAGNLALVPYGGNVGIGVTVPGRSTITTQVDIQVPYAKTDTTARYGLLIASNDLSGPLGAAFYNIGGATQASRSFNIQATEMGLFTSVLNLNPSGGNVGIGTTAPNYAGTGTFLSIENTTAAPGIDLYLNKTGVLGATIGSLKFWGQNTVSTKYELGRISGLNGATASSAGQLVFSTANTSAALTERMRIDESGNVGIGTTAPGAKLEISGAQDATSLRILSASDTKWTSIQMGRTTSDLDIGIVGQNAQFIGGSAVGDLAVRSNSKKMLFSTNNGTSANFGIDASGNIGLNTLNFGTTLAKGISIGAGTAPTAVAADATMLWTADQGGVATRNALHMMNESGQSGVVAHQAPLVNLLTNSGFGVWSNSTLETWYGPELLNNWWNYGLYPYDTLTSAGKNVTSAISDGSGPTYALSNAFDVVAGAAYTVEVVFTLNSGTAPGLEIRDTTTTPIGGARTLSAGTNTFTVIQPTTGSVQLVFSTDAVATNWSAVISYRKGGNLVSGWTNGGVNVWETFAASGSSITNAVNSSGTASCSSNTFTVTAGKLYKISINITGVSAPAMVVYSGDGLTPEDGLGLFTLPTGVSSYIYEAKASGSGSYVYVATGSLITTAGTFTLTEVTPGCVAVDTKGPDGWEKGPNDVDVFRETTEVVGGALYSMRAVTSTADSSIFWPTGSAAGSGGLFGSLEFVNRFKGRTVTFGAWIKTSTGSSLRLRVGSNVSAVYSPVYHSGGGGWEWLEVSYPVPSNATYFNIEIRASIATTFYVSQPVLAFSPSIGQGNAAPDKGTIWTEAPISLATLDNKSFSDVSATTLNLEVDSSGKIPKGAKAVYVRAQTNDSGSITITEGAPNTIVANATFLQLRADATQVAQFEVGPSGLPSDGIARHQGWQKCDANGNIQYTIEATGSGTFDIPVFQVLGIQV